ncbi:dual OB domain-containing protein [Asticcacaulis taihuensis]|uniref:dual OB domain-containing protein n=1 Tax=Asticcacaulis taihuensis TaxID=260084 RepID=UPI003F7BB62F
MAQYEMVVTDVTAYGPLFCVAGWDVARGKMIRPEPPTTNPAYNPTRFWDASVAGPGQFFSLGNVVKFEAALPQPNFPFPHATEDRVLSALGARSVVKKLTPVQLVSTVAASVSPSIGDIYNEKLTVASSGKAFVIIGEKVSSLGAIEVNSKNIVFHEDRYDPSKPKLRAYIHDGVRQYDLSITSNDVKSIWNQNGLDGVNASLGKYSKAHVRIGLSRPFPAMPEQCYVQINGMYLY